jgi:single-stranded DNA-binding protein
MGVQLMSNTIIVTGRVISEVATKEYGEGKESIRFSIAYKRAGSKKKDDGYYPQDLVSVSLYNDAVKYFDTSIAKGDYVDVFGTLRFSTHPETGAMTYPDILGNKVNKLAKKPEAQQNKQTQTAKKVASAVPFSTEEEDIDY